MSDQPVTPAPVTAEEVPWQDVLDQLSQAGMFFRLKAGKTRIRLVPPPDGNVRKFFTDVTTTFRGKTKTRFAVLGLVLAGSGAKPEMAASPVPILISKTVLKAIIQLLAEGYDLFSPNGYGLTLARAGEGLDTEYAVMASQKPIPLPTNMAYPEKTLFDLAREFEAWSASQQQNQGGAPAADAPAEEKDW